MTRSHALLTSGQYQILRVGPPGATGATAAVSAASQPSVAGNFQFCSLLDQYIFFSLSRSAVRPATASATPSVRLPTQPVALNRVSPAPSSTPTPAPAPSSNSLTASGAGGMGQQMTPDTAKIKCKNFLATLLRLASDQPESVARNVRSLIQVNKILYLVSLPTRFSLVSGHFGGVLFECYTSLILLYPGSY